MELISIEIGIFPKANCIILTLTVVKNGAMPISVIISVIIHKESH